MERSTRHAQRLTEGSILRSLVALSVPIVFANVLQTAYQLVDTFWVGPPRRRSRGRRVRELPADFSHDRARRRIGRGRLRARRAIRGRAQRRQGQSRRGADARDGGRRERAACGRRLRPVGRLARAHGRDAADARRCDPLSSGLVSRLAVHVRLLRLPIRFARHRRSAGARVHRIRHGPVEPRARSAVHLRLGADPRRPA